MNNLKDSKKFSLHVIDDHEEPVDAVKLALFPNGTWEELIDFKHFPSVGAAKHFYGNDNPILENFPTIALVDIDFTEENLPENEKGKLKGFELIEHLSKWAQNRTQIFAFTAHNDKKDVMVELHRRQLPGKLIVKGSEIDAQVSVPVQMILQKLAKGIVKNIATNYRNDLMELTKDFSNKPVGNTGFLLPCLLAGWGDVHVLHFSEVQEIVNDMLQEEVWVTEFRGVWRDPESPERQVLEQYKYLNRTGYERELKAINKMAFDLLVEFVGISEKDNFGEMEDRLSHQFFQQNFSVTSKIDVTPNAFNHKLIGRRAIAAFTHYFGNGGLSLNKCAVLLRDRKIPLIDPLFFDKNGEPLPAKKYDERGKVLKDEQGKHILRTDRHGNSMPLTKKEKEDMAAQRTSSVINTALGLSSAGGGNILIDENHLLPEERDFLKFVGDDTLEGSTYAVHFADFLANIINTERNLRIYFAGENVQNMSELKRFLDNVRINEPEVVPDVLVRFFNSAYLTNVPEVKRRAIFHLFDILV